MLRSERIRHFFHVWSRALFISVGHDIYGDGGFQPSLYTFFVYFILSLFLFSGVFTLIYYDWFVRLNVINFLAVAIEVSLVINTQQTIF